MAMVMSAGALETIKTQSWWPISSHGSLRLYDSYYHDYATIYRTQPNVRTCVEFLGRNIAQLGLHVFRRVSDTDRQRLTAYGLARTIGQPLPAKYKLTRYRLIDQLVNDLGIYFNAYWLKIRSETDYLGVLPVPPKYMQVEGGLVPTSYKITVTGKPVEIDPDDVVHFRGYSPDSSVTGLSPLETLRRVLAEEYAAGDYREHFWQNAARMHGVIERPASAPEWSPTARNRFKSEFEALYRGGENSGKTAVLEEDMKWKQVEFSAKDAEYLAGRKLTREECARAYHIPLPMVGILDNATFSNITEQHKNLYQDCIGPWLKMIEEDIELQLLPEFDDHEGVYVEFNIAEKLAGSFEEQAKAMQSAIGRPWMTANEGRARQNLPSMGGDADELVTPLNVLTGGQASPNDRLKGMGNGGLGMGDGGLETKALDYHHRDLRERHEVKWREGFVRHYRRQEKVMLSRLPKKSDIGGVWWDDERWNKELKNDLLGLNLLTASAYAKLVADALEAEVSEQRMMAWLDEHSRVQAEYINEQTRGAVAAALTESDPQEAVKGVFETAITVWATSQAVSAVTAAQNFGAAEGAQSGGMRRKTWQVNSQKPRKDHIAMNGETVGIRDRFSNGMRWPGDPAGGAEQNANCQCSVRFSE